MQAKAPAYFVATNMESKEFLLALRGTSEMGDMVRGLSTPMAGLVMCGFEAARHLRDGPPGEQPLSTHGSHADLKLWGALELGSVVPKPSIVCRPTYQDQPELASACSCRQACSTSAPKVRAVALTTQLLCGCNAGDRPHSHSPGLR